MSGEETKTPETRTVDAILVDFNAAQDQLGKAYFEHKISETRLNQALLRMDQLNQEGFAAKKASQTAQPAEA